MVVLQLLFWWYMLGMRRTGHFEVRTGLGMSRWSEIPDFLPDRSAGPEVRSGSAAKLPDFLPDYFYYSYYYFYHSSFVLLLSFCAIPAILQ